MSAINSVDALFDLLAKGGGEAYFGEPVTVLEHSLQAAWFVQQEGGSESLIVAALLHDVGHLLHSEGEDAAQHGIDTRHEELGMEALKDHLPAEVLDPIRLHVAAKRFLCFDDATYATELSAASLESLILQGGPLTAEEAEAFLALPHAREAVAVRRADDAAKVFELKVPELKQYRSLVTQFWR